MWLKNYVGYIKEGSRWRIKKQVDNLPNYNSSEYIDKTIKSVINQSFKN